MPVSAIAKTLRISAFKVRPYLQSVKGLQVQQALNLLKSQPSPTAATVAKVVGSASANAENNHLMSPSDLVIVNAYADEGPTLKRFRARARGRANRILKRTCQITIVVDEEIF